MKIAVESRIFRQKGGFSLVETLSVIGVIGVVSAIAIPTVGRVNESAREATARRNAQNIASVFASAQAAGLDFMDSTVDETVGRVSAGGIVTGGTFDGSFFGLPLSEDEQLRTLPYLTFSDQTLVYMRSGASIAPTPAANPTTQPGHGPEAAGGEPVFGPIIDPNEPEDQPYPTIGFTPQDAGTSGHPGVPEDNLSTAVETQSDDAPLLTPIISTTVPSVTEPSGQ